MKKQLLLTRTIGLFIILTFVNCERSKDCPDCFTPPGGISMEFISRLDSTDLITSGFYNKDSVSIYYKDDNLNMKVEIEFQTDTATQKTIIVSNDISWKSVSGFKNYFVKLNSADIDTVFLDIVKKTEGCCTFHPCNSFKYNEQNIQIDKTEYIYKILK